jgi:hypothetical protein
MFQTAVLRPTQNRSMQMNMTLPADAIEGFQAERVHAKPNRFIPPIGRHPLADAPWLDPPDNATQHFVGKTTYRFGREFPFIEFRYPFTALAFAIFSFYIVVLHRINDPRPSRLVVIATASLAISLCLAIFFAIAYRNGITKERFHWGWLSPDSLVIGTDAMASRFKRETLTSVVHENGQTTIVADGETYRIDDSIVVDAERWRQWVREVRGEA